MLDNGQTQCWGLNTHGQLGLGDTVTRGMVAGEMGFALPYVDVGAGRIVLALVAGVAHTCAVLDNARAKCWGNNAFGQLGLANATHRGGAESEMGDALPYVDVGLGRLVASLAAGESVNGEMRSSFILEAEITVLSADGERSGQSDSVPMKSPALTCTRPR